MHDMLGLGINISFPLILTDTHKRKVRKNMGDARNLVIDEISGCAPRVFLACHEVLRQVYDEDKPFGGINIILTGDFDQKLPPVGKNLAQVLVDSVSAKWHKKEKYDEDAALLFKMFRKYEFTGSHRFGSDRDITKDQRLHRRILHQIRYDPKPITRELLEKLPKLTDEDVASDEWRFAPTMVTGNAERQQVNELQIRNYARFHNLPILSYYVESTRGSNRNRIKRIVENIALKKPLTQVSTFHMHMCVQVLSEVRVSATDLSDTFRVNF